MIAGLDSSFDRPNSATAAAARAAGIRVWGGYIGTRGGLGLATLWSQADFDVVRNAGITPIGFCSGWDDPVALRDLARAWGVLPCVDVERGIRDDGPWVQGWLDASGAGLYGLPSVHSGRSAAFHIVAAYGVYPPACDDPQSVWPSWVPRPAGPLGWQFCGTHNEFGLSVDRGWYDDWFAGALTGGTVGGDPVDQATFDGLFSSSPIFRSMVSAMVRMAWQTFFGGHIDQAAMNQFAGTVFANPTQVDQVIGGGIQDATGNTWPTVLSALVADYQAGKLGVPTSGLAKADHKHDVGGTTGPQK